MSVIEQAIYEVENGNTEEGLRLLKDYEIKAMDDEKFTIAQVYYEWGLLDDAIKLYSELIDLYPEESEIKLLLADAYIDIEKDELAIDLLNSIKETDENYVQALMQSADLYQSQGLFEVSEHKLNKAKTILPTEPIIDYALGELFFSTGEYWKAINHYENAIKHNLRIEEFAINERLAEALAATGKWEEALPYYEKLSKENDNPDTMFNYGLTAYRSDRNDIAIQTWEKLLELDEDYTSVYLLLAKAYEKEGLLNKAYEVAGEGIRVNELNKELLHFAGLIANKLGETEESVNYLQKAILFDPDYKEAVMGLIDIFKKEDMFEEITKLLEKIRVSGEFDPMYQWELAKAYYELEQYPMALNNYDEAYNSFTSDLEFLKEYGYILVEEGRVKEALEVFRKYLIIDPSDIELEEYLQRLEQ